MRRRAPIRMALAALLLSGLLPLGARAATDAADACSSFPLSQSSYSPLVQLASDFNRHFFLPAKPGPLAAVAAIYGKDHRVLMPQGYPWNTIGKLHAERKDDGYDCTGTLVGSCYLLTAGHCVSEENGKPVDPSRLSFQAGNGGPSSGVENYRYTYHENNHTEDWAILRLDSNLGGKLGQMGVRNVSAPMLPTLHGLNSYMLPGYSTDRYEGTRATMDGDVKVVPQPGNASNEIFLLATAHSGASGAPLIYFDDKGTPWIVGIYTRGVSGKNGEQVTLTPDVPPGKLARGVATQQFYDRMIDFMQKNPCNRFW